MCVFSAGVLHLHRPVFQALEVEQLVLLPQVDNPHCSSRELRRSGACAYFAGSNTSRRRAWARISSGVHGCDRYPPSAHMGSMSS